MQRFTEAILRVGDGRGFVAEIPSRNQKWLERVVITAAHCLPTLPPAHVGAGLEDTTFFNLLGPLDGETNTAAECYFADPVADIALLGAPDNQELSEECDRYDTLVEDADTLALAPMDPTLPVRLCDLNRLWFGAKLNPNVHHKVWVFRTARHEIEAGMSGSPIIQEGKAIGVLSIGPYGPNPLLTHDLPARVFSKIRKRA